MLVVLDVWATVLPALHHSVAIAAADGLGSGCVCFGACYQRSPIMLMLRQSCGVLDVWATVLPAFCMACSWGWSFGVLDVCAFKRVLPAFQRSV